MWDERGHEFTHIYDELRRPVEVIVDEGSGDKLINFMVYGDNAGITSPEDDNLKGQLIRAFDQSGVNRIIEIDFKGNPLSSEREFATNYKTTIDWSGLTALTTLSSIDSTSSSSLEGETFSSSIEYDALNRPTTITRPDSSKILPTYNEAGMLESVEVKIRGAGSATTFISDINYNEKGQRTKIVYGNGARTKFTYDPDNFRLTRILTTRNSGANILQDQNYTFDPVGNITEMRDNALQTHYFQNSVVSPNGKYEYDALYRLTRSTGREHYGQAQISHNDFSINTAVPQNNNANAVENYTETYEYDEIGNILKLIHQATSGNWTRGYYYDSSTSNYLLKTSLPGDTVSDSNTYSASYTHDTHGNMTSMPHLSSMIWDFHDQLREVDLGGGGTAWYVYDAQGTRVRKVIENGTLKKDRIYLDEINEYYREYISGSKDYERETLHIMDDRKRLAVVETKTWDAGSAVVTPSPVIRYQFDNHLGSASLELDTSANIISYEEYHPFGTSAYRLGSSVSEVSLKRYRYVGKERDDESGLYYYGARYYAAWLGRWTAVDPLASEYPNLNSYCFVACNPIVFLDPDGKRIIITGSKEYKNEVLKTIIHLIRDSKTARKAIFKSLISKNTLVVTQKEGGSYVRKKTGTDKNGHIVTKMVFDLDSNQRPLTGQVDGTKQINGDNRTVFAHELFHHLVYTGEEHVENGDTKIFMGGVDFYNDDGSSNTFIYEEVLAVDFENKVRAELGEELRTHYGGRKVINMEITDSEVDLYDKKNNRMIRWFDLQEKDESNKTNFSLFSINNKSTNARTWWDKNNVTALDGTARSYGFNVKDINHGGTTEDWIYYIPEPINSK